MISPEGIAPQRTRIIPPQNTGAPQSERGEDGSSKKRPRRAQQKWTTQACVTDQQHGVAHAAKATCSSEPSHVSTLVHDRCANARKGKRTERVFVCCMCRALFLFFDFWRAVRQSTNREIPPRCYATLSGQVFRRSLRLGVTMQDRACAAMGNSSALWQSRFRRRSVGRTPKSLDRAGSHSPISTS